MKLHTSYPYWLMKNGCTMVCDTLNGDLDTQVAVIGGGISGSLTAYTLARSGIDCVLLEKHHPACGSTAASTALLQFEIDAPMHKLAERYGFDLAADAYQSCSQAIDDIEAICLAEELDADFCRLPSLQYASRPKDAAGLIREAAIRQRAGLDSRYLARDEIQDLFDFDAPAALLSPQAAQVDAYRLAQGLVQAVRDRITVCDGVTVEAILPDTGRLELCTDSGFQVHARHVVVACGYESSRFLDKQWYRCTTTYALASKPLEGGLPDCLLWETAKPYLYVRTTADGRILAGGRDDEVIDPTRREAALPGKIAALLQDLGRCLPHTRVVPDFTWAGTFGETEDSLAYIGALPAEPRVHYLLGFGGNGVVFSLIGAKCIRDTILGRKNPHAATYAFSR